MDVETQALQVKKVKKSTSGMIIDPISVHPKQTLEFAENLNALFKMVDYEQNIRFEPIPGRHIGIKVYRQRLIGAEKELSLELILQEMKEANFRACH